MASPFASPASALHTAPALVPGSVHVWRSALDVPAAALERYRALLTTAERVRADRYLRPAVGARWTAARAITRRVLGAYCRADPGSLVFTLGEHRKPSLAAAPIPLEFSVSHSGAWVAIALSGDGAVGVDIEQREPSLDLASVARFSFSPAEQRALAEVPLAERREAFYACWTRKEAYIKAIGMGLSMPLDAFEVSLAPGAAPALIASRLRPGDPAYWRLTSFEAAPELSGALATNPQVTRFAWFAYDGVDQD